VFQSITTALANNKSVSAQSQATVSSSAICKSHVYSVVDAFTDASGNKFVTVRNPWGNDGMTGSDNNYNDALITLSLADFQKNFYNVVWTA
jgi:hypothetical protein